METREVEAYLATAEVPPVLSAVTAAQAESAAQEVLEGTRTARAAVVPTHRLVVFR